MNTNTLANFLLAAYQNQSPFIILLRDLPAQVLKTLELEKVTRESLRFQKAE
jgi:hypothetical protein